MRELTKEFLDKLTQWEGEVLFTYDDAVGAVPFTGGKPKGTLTIGVGHTGPDVKPGMKITKAQSRALLLEDLAEAQGAVERLVKVELAQPQYEALVSFVFNLGEPNFSTSTLLRKLNASDYAAIPKEFMKWTKRRVNGKLVHDDGLQNRRMAEVGWWSRGTFVASRNVAPAPATPISITPEMVTITSGILGTIGSATITGPLQYALAAVVVGAFAVAAWSFIRRRV